jgi:hypothetical protein
MRLAALARVLVVACGLTQASATSWDYTISVPDGREATFELPFTVEYAGPVTIEATWSGSRLLFFGVEGPGHVVLARRSGPSPQRLDLTADAAAHAPSGGAAWKLTIKALPARGEATGRLRVTAPDAPEVVARREAELHPPPPPPPPPPAWTLPKAAQHGAPADILRVYAAVETFRAAVIDAKDGRADACTWQIDFLKSAAAARDRLGDRGKAPEVPIARNEIVRPIERSLDELTELLRGGHAPALEEESWLPRLTACLTACERFYDERVRLGGDENAPNGDLAAAQWDRVLAAGRIFASFGPFLKEPSPPDR